MTVWVAFLRGINLGKRQMRMAELKACCEAMGLRGVKTILASGNVRFAAERDDGLKARLESGLEEKFGYPVAAVLRSAAQIEAMVAAQPFADVDPEADVALHVLLADGELAPAPDLGGLPAHIEVARVDAREIYFIAHRLPNGRYTEGLEQLERVLPNGALVTMRNWNTILRVRT